ncbi:S9 family peptidase [Chitinophaga sp. sic0106]|uniref:alpha/beta hydrolase family protein n=1 Tax=Chitinophaga sp. sic0106 TaxID=2854785 RepID=UPI001C453A12|nr:prolyl oligopeptidase family serine peptidase [Chitinophaga sp. sic0106]MBV7533165.1 prolyl oligopeptidase family serine peptidase [Chitinophaga sp. sic0106]
MRALLLITLLLATQTQAQTWLPTLRHDTLLARPVENAPEIIVATNWQNKRIISTLQHYAYYMETSQQKAAPQNPVIWFKQPTTTTNPQTALIDLKTGRTIPMGDTRSLLIRTYGDTVLMLKQTDKRILEFTQLSTGAKHQITNEKIVNGAMSKGLSPDGQLIVYYDNNAYHCYHISQNQTQTITKDIHTDLHYIYRNDLFTSPRGIAGWNSTGTKVYIYDAFDLWEVDLNNNTPAVNLTKGYGAKHRILFSVQTFTPNKPLEFPLILSAFNIDNKQNGWYKLTKGKEPELLTMGDYQYDIKDNPYVPDGSNFPPIKRNDSIIVRRQSATEAPNLFYTKDFKHFTQLTFNQPDHKYTAQLTTYNTLDSQQRQAILYKPTDFDSTKKYPVIVHFYERKSDALNSYLKTAPLTSGCNINIPTYTQNGYLVFAPDIFYTPGDPMQSAYDAVLGAAEYLEKLNFVDPKRIGLQGCSWGAIQINYLVTHTNKFAAAVSASGIADWISAYNSLVNNGRPNSENFENGQFRMKATPWDIPEQYLKNSSLYAANNMNTPLLLMHTTNDGACPFTNILSFFLALRRLQKPAWLLQYSDGNHGLTGTSATDFSERMQAFFDHYLKNATPTDWLSD